MKNLIIIFLTLIAFSCTNYKSNKSEETNTNINSSQTEIKQDNDSSVIVKEDSAIYIQSKKITNQKDDFKGFVSFYKQFDKAFQTFTIDPNTENAITCKEGTQIKISPNSFVTESGKPVEGKIQIKVKEFYSISDILLSNLGTTSDNEILETGGMIYVETYSNGEKCKVKEGLTIEIAFPTKNEKSDMHLFHGKWSSGKLNWTMAKTETVDEEPEIFMVVEQMPEFPGGTKKLMKYINDNLKYPKVAKDNGIQGTVYMQFIVAKNGSINDVKVLRGVDPMLDREAVSLIKKMPKWIPGKQRGKNVPVCFTVPINFKFNDAVSNTYNEKYVNEFESKNGVGILSDTKISEVSRYIFSSMDLGWLNCDRFYYNPNPKIDFCIDVGNLKQVDIKLVFSNIKAMLYGSLIGSNYVFENVPTGETVTIVALKFEKNQYYLAIKNTTTSIDGEHELDFKPVTMARLKAEIKKLNW